jgi:RimJ/RimL family protein N-acetyltransferase
VIIRLRAPIDSDIPIFFEHQREADAMRMAAFTSKDPNDRGAFDAHWKRVRGDDVRIRTIEADGEVAGYVASFIRGDVREVSYWLGSAHWGRGIATSALAKFLGEEETRRPLVGRAASDNVASRRVLEKCGFVVDHHERAFANARGEEIEEVVMRLDHLHGNAETIDRARGSSRESG